MGERNGRRDAAGADGGAPRTAASARAEAESRREEVRAARAEAFRAAYGTRAPGRWVLVASWATTVLFALAAALAASTPASTDVMFVTVSLGLFCLGCLWFLVDIVLAAGRSRDAAMGIGGLFFLAGSAPPRVQQHLLGSLGVQVVVALVGAAVGFARIDDRQLNALAFGILVPVVALAACGYWAVRWGVFPDREVPTPGGRSR